MIRLTRFAKRSTHADVSDDFVFRITMKHFGFRVRELPSKAQHDSSAPRRAHVGTATRHFEYSKVNVLVKDLVQTNQSGATNMIQKRKTVIDRLSTWHG